MFRILICFFFSLGYLSSSLVYRLKTTMKWYSTLWIILLQKQRIEAGLEIVTLRFDILKPDSYISMSFNFENSWDWRHFHCSSWIKKIPLNEVSLNDKGVLCLSYCMQVTLSFRYGVVGVTKIAKVNFTKVVLSFIFLSFFSILIKKKNPVLGLSLMKPSRKL